MKPDAQDVIKGLRDHAGEHQMHAEGFQRLADKGEPGAEWSCSRAESHRVAARLLRKEAARMAKVAREGNP